MADDTVIFGLQTSKNACNVRIKYLRLNCMLLFVVVFLFLSFSQLFRQFITFFCLGLVININAKWNKFLVSKKKQPTPFGPPSVAPFLCHIWHALVKYCECAFHWKLTRAKSTSRNHIHSHLMLIHKYNITIFVFFSVSLSLFLFVKFVWH